MIFIWQIYPAGNSKIYLGLHVKCTILLPDFNQILISQWIFIKSPISNFTEILPVGVALIPLDRQMGPADDKTMLLGTF
jgi:hypothetical protein